MLRFSLLASLVCVAGCGRVGFAAVEADLGPIDGGRPDLGDTFDAGPTDLGAADQGPPDLGPTDLGAADLGPTSCGQPCDPGLPCATGVVDCAGGVETCVPELVPAGEYCLTLLDECAVGSVAPCAMRSCSQLAGMLPPSATCLDQVDVAPVMACSSIAAQCENVTDGVLGGLSRPRIALSCAMVPGACSFAGACATNGCIEDFDVHFDLQSSTSVRGVRISADWFSKRPERVEVYTGSSLGAAEVLVVARDLAAPSYRCVTGEPCGPAVPDICCPAGRDQPQDTTAEGDFVPQLDWAPFPASTTGRYFTLRTVSTFDPNTMNLFEVEFVR